MKKKLLLILIVLFAFVVIPFNVNAKKDKATVYLFRGKGCTYCRALLTYLNSINDEVGDMYELKAYEVWNSTDNSQLMKDISEFLGSPAQGVPYLIIGNKVFPGYYDGYNEEIKSAIKSLYKTEASKRYDVFKEYKKEHELTKKYKSQNLKQVLKEEGIEYNDGEEGSSKLSSSTKVIICNLVITVLAAGAVVAFVNYKVNKLDSNITKNINKANKVEKPKKVSKK